MNPREIAKMRKNMQKVPIIQEKGDAVQAVEAQAAESKLDTVLENGHLDSKDTVDVNTNIHKNKSRWSRFIKKIKSVLGI